MYLELIKLKEVIKIKNSKHKIPLIIFTFLLIVILIIRISSVYAFFNDTAEFINLFLAGNIDIKIEEEFEAEKAQDITKYNGNDAITKSPKITNNGEDAYIFAEVLVPYCEVMEYTLQIETEQTAGTSNSVGEQLLFRYYFDNASNPTNNINIDTNSSITGYSNKNWKYISMDDSYTNQNAGYKTYLYAYVNDNETGLEMLKNGETTKYAVFDRVEIRKELLEITQSDAKDNLLQTHILEYPRLANEVGEYDYYRENKFNITINAYAIQADNISKNVNLSNLNEIWDLLDKSLIVIKS